MSKTGVIWLSPALVQCPLYLAVATSEAAYKRELKRLKQPYKHHWLADASAAVHTFEHSGGQLALIVCIPPRGKRPRAAYAALIVHEATHVWQSCRDYLCERDPSKEFEAYSLQNICQSLFEAVGL